ETVGAGGGRGRGCAAGAGDDRSQLRGPGTGGGGGRGSGGVRPGRRNVVPLWARSSPPADGAQDETTPPARIALHEAPTTAMMSACPSSCKRLGTAVAVSSAAHRGGRATLHGSPVERAVGARWGEVLHLDGGARRQVGDRPRNLEHAVVSARREPEP